MFCGTLARVAQFSDIMRDSKQQIDQACRSAQNQKAFSGVPVHIDVIFTSFTNSALEYPRTVKNCLMSTRYSKVTANKGGVS